MPLIATSVFSSGTAKFVSFRSVLPVGTRAQEVFWVKTLLGQLPELRGRRPRVRSAADDSHSKPDVLVKVRGMAEFGVQVTSLVTWEIPHAASRREKLATAVLTQLRRKGASCPSRVLVHIEAPKSQSRGNFRRLPSRLATEIREMVAAPLERVRVVTIGGARVFIRPLEAEATFYVPHYNNIGIDTSVGYIDFSWDKVRTLIHATAEKKRTGKGKWLLLHNLGMPQLTMEFGSLLEQTLRDAFVESPYERVFFLESLDGRGFFEANLRAFIVKDEAMEH